MPTHYATGIDCISENVQHLGMYIRALSSNLVHYESQDIPAGLNYSYTCRILLSLKGVFLSALLADQLIVYGNME